MAGDEPQPDIDELAAALRADATDLEDFAEVLAGKLEEALPTRTRVERRRAGLLGPKRVRRIVVRLDDAHLELVSEQGGVEATRSTVSRGIALKHERLDVEDWVWSLSEALAGEAARNAQARRALERLLI